MPRIQLKFPKLKFSFRTSEQEGEEQVRVRRAQEPGLRQCRAPLVRAGRKDAALQPEDPCAGEMREV